MYKGKSLSFSITNPNIEILAEKIEDAMATIDALPEDPDFVDIETDTRKADERIKTNNIEQMSLEKKINYLKSLQMLLSHTSSKYLALLFVTTNIRI